MSLDLALSTVFTVQLRTVFHRCTDLLRPTYRDLVEAGAVVSTGHCYVASEVLYHAL